MRCKRCGIRISKGSYCENCYNEIIKEKEMDNDNFILMRIGRKFIPKYSVLQNWEWIAFCILVVLCSFISKNILTAIACIIFVIIILAFSLFFSKRIAKGTKCTFYETKVVYKFDFGFIHRKRIFKYSEIKDIVYNQKRLQKKFGLGTITIISKKANFIFNGVIVEDVANVENVFKKLTELVGTKII